MRVRPVTWRLLGAGVVLVALVVVAALAYRTRLSTALRVSGSSSAQNPFSAPAGDLSTCAALPPELRRSAPRLTLLTGDPPHTGALRMISLSRCSRRTLVGAGVTAPLRESADGRWVGYGAAVVAAQDGRSVQRPLGSHIWADPTSSTWAWSPVGDELAGVTVNGALIVGRPGEQPRTLESAGWGASSVLFADATHLVVVRDGDQLWSISLADRRVRLIARTPSRENNLVLATATGGWVVAWVQPFVSASSGADGAPLYRISVRTGRAVRLASSVLLAPGYVVRCGPGLAIAAGAGREATVGKTVVVYDAAWRARRVGEGIAPSCSRNGRVVAFAAGRPVPSMRIGTERRRIFVSLVGGGRPRPVGPPPRTGPGANDPIVSANGRAVLWVESEGPVASPLAVEVRGALRGALVGSRRRQTGPIADAGRASDYYGSLSWPETVIAG